MEAKKGDSIAEILEKCQEAFPPLKGTVVPNLIFVKENIILPHVLSDAGCLVFKDRLAFRA